jgi:hypothetical protein
MECGKNDPNVQSSKTAGCVPVISGEGVREFFVEEQGLYIKLGLKPRSRYKDPKLFRTAPKLLVRFVATHPFAAVDEKGVANFNTVYNCMVKAEHAESHSPYFLAALLNSRVVRWWFERAFESDEDLYPHIQKYQLECIPLPNDAADASTRERLDQLGKLLVEARSAAEIDEVRAEVDELSCGIYGLPRRLSRVPIGNGERRKGDGNAG